MLTPLTATMEMLMALLAVIVITNVRLTSPVFYSAADGLEPESYGFM